MINEADSSRRFRNLISTAQLVKRIEQHGYQGKYTEQALYKLFEKYGITPKTQRGGKSFFNKKNACDCIERHIFELKEMAEQLQQQYEPYPEDNQQVGYGRDDMSVASRELLANDDVFGADENELYRTEGRKTITISEDKMRLFDVFKNIKVNITESQYNRLFEGVVYTATNNRDYPISTTITPIKYNTSSATDSANKLADTRFLGTRNDILFGDNTTHKGVKNLEYNYFKCISQMKSYEDAITCVKNGSRTNPEIYQDKYSYIKTINAIKAHLLSDKPDDVLITTFEEGYRRAFEELNMIENLYKRASEMSTDSNGFNYFNADEKIPRYSVGIVPGTDVKVISLFKFENFNFSDAIKNGELRQDELTDELLNIDKNDRERNAKLYGRGTGTQKKINTMYDNSVIPDVANNFSLGNGAVKSKTHPKQQFKSRSAYNSDEEYNNDSKEGYNSVTQFIDKSILAASYAIRNENLKIDYIIAAPSSSPFNHYFCTRLSRKTGIEYRPNFFDRSLICAKLDESIYSSGLPDKIITDTEERIKNAALIEISSILMEDVKKFIRENYNGYLSNISLTKSSREKVPFDLLCEFLKHYSYYGLVNMYEKMPKTSNVYMYLVNHFMDYVDVKNTSRNYDEKHILSELLFRIRTRLSKKYQILLETLDNKIKILSNYLKDENGGWKLSYCKKFKITDIDAKARPYIKNAYVVSDSELDVDDNLYERYRNANFLIFDEDMNSGATLKLLISALEDNVVGGVGKRGRRPHIKSENITCMVNAYTLK